VIAVPVIAVHGGAGALSPRPRDPELRTRVLAALDAALRAGGEVLALGGSALDSVVAAVRILEDGLDLNAGRGAALTVDGTAELDAAVADGAGRRTGAVAAVRRVRNPVDAARLVLDMPAVLIAGQAADELAETAGLAMVDPSYFVTPARADALRRQLSEPKGTVGAVALDAGGHLAAATSTGGMTGQAAGRVGDTPIFGAGTWADDATCAVSATGDGEAFIRAAFAHVVHLRVASGLDLATACDEALGEVTAMGGSGGCIAVDRLGTVALPFTTAAMYRGSLVIGEGNEPELAVD
jgi:isoaspartyl peptidase/L-asparaginase-like protein (Ntn-hydrolase superfamily)